MRKLRKLLTDIRLWYGLTGVVISIAAHELFHIAAHIGHIERIDFFPNLGTIVEISVNSPGLLPHDIEEMIAYVITVLILFLTIIDVYAIHDSRDKRSVNEILYPKRKTSKRN